MPGGVFSIESWSEELRSRVSVRPLLAVLEQHGDARVIQQRVATQPEVGYYLHRFAELKNYAVGHLATGPSAASMQPASDPVSLDTLLGWAIDGPTGPRTSSGQDPAEESADGGAHAAAEPTGRLLDLSGKAVVLSGLSNLRCTPERLRELQEASGALAICAYVRDVPWIEAAGFELILLAALAEATAGRRHTVPAAIKRLWRISGQLMDELGFISSPNYDPAAEGRA